MPPKNSGFQMQKHLLPTYPAHTHWPRPPQPQFTSSKFTPGPKFTPQMGMSPSPYMPPQVLNQALMWPHRLSAWPPPEPGPYFQVNLTNAALERARGSRVGTLLQGPAPTQSH